MGENDANKAPAFMGREKEPERQTTKNSGFISCIGPGGLNAWCSLAGSDWTGKRIKKTR